MRGVGTHEFGVNRLELEPQIIEALAQDQVSSFRLRERVGPGVHQRPDRLVPVKVGDGDLQLVGGRFSPDTRHLNPVLAHLIQLDRRKVGDPIRRDVGAGITHFVHELLGN